MLPAEKVVREGRHEATESLLPLELVQDKFQFQA